MLIAVAIGATAPALWAKSLQGLLTAPTEFTILGADTGKVVGHGRYSAIQTSGGIELRGDNRYLDGAYDIEDDRLALLDGRPVLTKFHHSFFHAGGAPDSDAQADTVSGFCSCVYYQGTAQTREDKKLEFSSDTYAGVTVLLPIQEFLRTRRDGAKLELHVFNCAPGPRVFALDVEPEAGPIRWAHYPARELEQVDIKPNFGFWNLVVLPFIPKLAGWFDPADDWEIIGARLQRYYRGPNIIMVRKPGPVREHAADVKNPSVAGGPPP